MIVLTGPTGNVGAEVARLAAQAVQETPDLAVRVAAHRPERVRAELGGSAATLPVVGFDYDDRATWPAVLDGVERLFLVFPLPTPQAVNRRMVPLVDAAVAAGCRHVVYLSVPGADVQKVVPHYRVERHLEASGADWTFLRAAFFMQNLHRAVSTHGVDIADHDEVFVPAGRGATSFVDARDIAEVAWSALTRPGAHARAAYVLTGPQRLRMDEVAAVLSDVLGRPIRYSRPGLARFWHRLSRRGVPWDSLLFMTIVYTLTRTGRNEPMTDELPRLLGRPPRDLRRWAEDARWRWEQRAWT
jgi:uncharacterized protein YbjT (DUF2867 family)